MRPHPSAALVVLLLASACAGSPPLVPGTDTGSADPVLVLGRDVWGRSCASCHAPDGSGGRGPSMRAVEDRFTDIQDQLTVVEDGRGGMPGFRGRYTTVEIEAVVRYTREVL
ncbi:MAG: cytochrome c [Actinomycetota bacterium]|nr:cytochrome c [Actinomycetota bacterium]MEC9467081.1 cytochrome c [Actinomycetota bacterium]